MARRGLQLLAGVVAIPVGVATSLGLMDWLRSVPAGPRVWLALPLRETGHADRASVVVVIAVWAIVFGLAGLVVPSSRHPARRAWLQAGGALACALTVQAVSVQLVRQASVGLDWNAALISPAPYLGAVGALLGSAAAGWALSSDRRRRSRPQERPVEGRTKTAPLAKVRS